MTVPVEKKKSVRWQQVKAPKPWKPAVPDFKIGEYIGTREHHGDSGPYRAIYFRTEEGCFYVTGTVIVNLMNAARCDEGDLIKIEFLGLKGGLDGSYPYKDFNLFIEAKKSSRLDET